MRARGYLIEVELTDDSLIAEGTNKVGQLALRGQQHNQGPLTIPRSEIAGVVLKRASALVNGNLVVRTSSGEKYELHFRKKSQHEFATLAAALS